VNQVRSTEIFNKQTLQLPRTALHGPKIGALLGFFKPVKRGRKGARSGVAFVHRRFIQQV